MSNMGTTNKKIELSNRIVVMSFSYLSNGLHNNESSRFSNKYSAPVQTGNGMASTVLINQMNKMIFKALLKLLDSFWANNG
jgi:hypothetical protein